ncbi:sodium:solute symporter [Endozoicomonas sp. (ex Bugula neritina AB1)]|nr:sodium:solute symporter [Endozoicomonas sp. (ex Bugula neritina AB1)]
MVSLISFGVMATYATLTLLISYLINFKRDTGGDFCTGNKQFGWLTVGISILATYVSSMSFIGVPGWVYQSGLESLVIHLNYPIVIFFSILYFVPVFYRLGVSSIYEYLEMRFGVRARLLNSIIFLLVQSLSAGIILYAVALIIVQVVPIPIFQAIIVLSLFTAIYTFFGGIATVIWTDVMQSGVLLIGAVVILFFLFNGSADTAIIEGLADKLNILNFSTDFRQDTTLAAGLIAVSFLHLSVYGSNQLIIQRTLATRTLKDAQRSMLVCGYGSFFIYALFGTIGLFLFIFYDGQAFENSNNIILDFVFNYTSPATIGLVMSALVAAAMSTLDSTYNSMATVMTYDIYKRFFRKDANDKHYETIARRFSLICAILVVIPSIMSISNESVIKSIANIVSIFVGIRLGSFLLGLFSRTANESGILVASLISVLAIIACRMADIAWPWYAPVGTLIFVIAGYITSQFTGALTENQQHFAYQQRALFCKPTTSHYLLLVFCGLTILACYLAPDILAVMLSA